MRQPSRPAGRHTRPFPSSRSFARDKSSFTPMRRGRLPHCCCRHVHVDGPERSSGRNASPSGITPSNILSPTRSQPGPWTEVRLGARAHTLRSIQRAHAPPRPTTLFPLLERHLTPGARTSKQQRRADCSYPCEWALATSVRRTHAALLLSCQRGSASRAGKGVAVAARCRRRAQRSREEQPRCVIRRPRRGHVRAVARCRRPPSLARHAAGVSRRSAAAQQGDALPGRPTEDRGDRRRHAACRRRRPRPPAAVERF
jgi:hypothetical protein